MSQTHAVLDGDRQGCVCVARRRREEAAVLKGPGQAGRPAMPQAGRENSKARVWVPGDGEK